MKAALPFIAQEMFEISLGCDPFEKTIDVQWKDWEGTAIPGDYYRVRRVVFNIPVPRMMMVRAIRCGKVNCLIGEVDAHLFSPVMVNGLDLPTFDKSERRMAIDIQYTAKLPPGYEKGRTFRAVIAIMGSSITEE